MHDTPATTPFGILMARGHDLWARIQTFSAVLKIVRFSLLVPAVLVAALLASDPLTAQ